MGSLRPPSQATASRVSTATPAKVTPNLDHIGYAMDIALEEVEGAKASIWSQVQVVQLLYQPLDTEGPGGGGLGGWPRRAYRPQGARVGGAGRGRRGRVMLDPGHGTLGDLFRGRPS